MPVTFKLQSPHGICRRATFPSAPELSALAEVAESMVQANDHRLLYRDSEGDWVLITSSSDVADTVKDAQHTGAATVKVYVRPCFKKHQKPQPSSTTGAAARSKPHRRPCRVFASNPLGTWGGLHRWALAPFHQPPLRRSFVSFDHHDHGGTANDIEEIFDTVYRIFFPNEDSEAAAAEESKESKAEESKAEKTKADESKADESNADESNAVESDADELNAEMSKTYRTTGTSSHQNDNGADTGGNQKKGATEEIDDDDHHNDSDADSQKGLGQLREASQGHHQANASEVADEESNEEDAVPSTTTGRVGVNEHGKPNPVAADDFVEVVAPKPEEVQDHHETSTTTNSASTPEGNSVDAKVKLLRDMGFEMPTGVARNMIKEMGGRMDLLVRALVANGK